MAKHEYASMPAEANKALLNAIEIVDQSLIP
jgi:hypothetical protein